MLILTEKVRINISTLCPSASDVDKNTFLPLVTLWYISKENILKSEKDNICYKMKKKVYSGVYNVDNASA